MIAFSSDQKVAGGGVYLLSFLAGRDVPRIVSFALSRGKRNFAELIPQSPYGRLAEKAFARSVGRGGGQAVVRASFPPNDANAMLGPVRQVANAMKAGQVDALFLPAAPEDLPVSRAAPRLERRDQQEPSIHRHRTMGLPQCRARRRLVGGWFPAPDPSGWSKFTSSYSKTYGARRRASRASLMTR